MGVVSLAAAPRRFERVRVRSAPAVSRRMNGDLGFGYPAFVLLLLYLDAELHGIHGRHKLLYTITRRADRTVTVCHERSCAAAAVAAEFVTGNLGGVAPLSLPKGLQSEDEHRRAGSSSAAGGTGAPCLLG